LYYIAHLAAQFAAVPGRIGTIPRGADPRQVQAFKQSLMNFAFNTAMTVPPEFKVTPFNGNSGFDFIKLIDHHNHMMSKSVLASFLDQEQRTTLIDIGNVDPNTDFFVMALESIMDDIAEQLSMYLMPKYIDWNFGTKKYPVFKFGQLSDAARDAIKDIFNVVVTSTTLNSTPEFVRELEKKLSATLDLDIDYDAIEEQEKQAAEEEAANAANEADAMLEPPSPDGGAAPQPGVAGGGGDQEVPPPGPPQVAMSNPTIDDIVSMAVELLGERPEPEIPDPV
jgi:outer membrane murein-binding lipoprotein Lpp